MPLIDWYGEAEAHPEFSQDEIDVFIESFKIYDKDGSGSISLSELEEAMRYMGMGLTKEEALAIMHSVDKDGNLEIDWPEFLQLMSLCYPDKRIQFEKVFLDPARKFYEFTLREVYTFVRAFREFDANGSGDIDADELGRLMKFMGQGAPEDEVEALLKKFDEDNSGVIEWPEFLAIMSYFYPWKKVEAKKLFWEAAINFPEFSNAEIEVFIETFRQFDLDGSGGISADELWSALHYMGQGTSRQEVEQLIEAVDSDDSGELEFGEFLTVMRVLYPEKRRQFEREFYGAALAYPEFTRDEVDVFIQTFRQFDEDGSGSIDAAELSKALQYMGQGGSPSNVERVISLVDEDGSGEVEWPEFLAVMRLLYPQRRQEFEDKFYGAAKKFPEFSKDEIDVFIESFRKFDLDGNGSIDADELGVAFKYMGQGSTPQQLTQIVAAYDADGSGEIDWDEYLQILSDLYKGKFNESAPSAPPAASPAPKAATPAPAPAATPAPAAAAAPAPAAAPAKEATPAAAPAPAKASGFVSARPSSAAASAPLASHRGGATNKCPTCSKTVYPLEALVADNNTYHKGCFRCQLPGCNITLTLKNFTAAGGSVYCPKHAPQLKPTQTTVDGNMIMSTATSAPKTARVVGVQRDRRNTFRRLDFEKSEQ